MKYIIANLKPYWKGVLLLVLLLFLQAYADLALPQYTQDIIDVGIQNKGIQHVVPERITESRHDQASLFMTDGEQKAWNQAFLSDGDIMVRKDLDDETLQELDETLMVPLVMAYQMEHADAGQFSDAEAVEKLDLTDPAVRQQIRQKMDDVVSAAGSQMLKNMGIAYAAECVEEAGLDLAEIQKKYLWKEGFQMILMALLMMLAASAIAFIASRIGASVGRDLRGQVFRHVIDYSSAEMDHFSTASLITRCTNDVQQIQMVTTMILRMVMLAPIMGFWGIVKIVGTGAHMGWIIVLSVCMILACVSILLAFTMPKFRIMQKLVDALNLVSREILTGLSVIRAFRREETEERRFDKASTALMKTQLFTSRAMSLMQPVMMLIMFGTTVLITWVAAHRIDMGELQVGAMTAFITYAMMIVMSFLILTVMSIILPRAGVAAERIHEVVTTETSIQDPEEPVLIAPAERDGRVRFDHVCFRYPGAERDVLSDIDFTAEPGMTTAIIGSTGSGKSTLVNLIPRFFDVTEGQITIDGVDVRKRSLDELRGEIGFVPQKGILFSGTIESNLRFGAADAPEEDVTRAAEIAQAADFIAEKEDGYGSFIAQGGSNVSGGQKQRLAFARALAKKPKILVFDDSFSALDMKTDAKLRQELGKRLSGVTTIVVAQRVSTILQAEQILVLDEGRIVGKGTHRELMKTCQVYQQIAKSQLSEEELEVMM